MATILSLPATSERTRRSLPEVLFTSPWMALAIPLLVPLAIFWF